MGKASRDKGKRGERELASLLRSYGFEARRGVQYKGGADSPDVVGIPGVHIEVKRAETLRLYDALEQSEHDAAENEHAAVFHRKNGREWVVIERLEDWIKYHTGKEKND